MNRRARYNSTLVLRQGKWCPNPTKVLTETIQKCTDVENEKPLVNLHLLGIALTPKLVHLLTQVLEEHSWDYVYFHQCPTSPGLDCSQLGHALSNRVQQLLLEETPSLVDILLDHCITQCPINVSSLTIRQRHGLSKTQCYLLGCRLMNSPNLKELSLKGTTIQAPALLAPGLATSYSLETLVLADTCDNVRLESPQGEKQECSWRQGLADLLWPRPGEFGIGAVSRLLQSPQSALKRLDLSNLQLQNEHASRLAQLLHNRCSLEQLNLSFNDIGCDGIVQFSKQLPSIQGLKQLSLKPNPWSTPVAGQALVRGMQGNVSIEYLDSLLYLRQAPLLRYYTAINRGGRRILSQQVPLSLWPTVLERAWRIHYVAEDEEAEQQAKLHALYCLLQNGPVLYLQRV